ncbi:hypothetical protein R6242_19685 [Iodobacter sp. CM08]|uniref:hypothetical protein n=1 Tax=Iodobacter sp. CM08 TaxID=3085902 RepID=UPI00298254F8|nr:hypothetical protein [Iodobacter sp. CM08]MDW5418794.1 hypothetical protein [Iodobacter sp. CM08]
MINFDESKFAVVNISTQSKPVILNISDGLALYNEVIMETFKERIYNFIEKASIWYPICLSKMASDGAMNTHLITMYILSEEFESNLIIGLEFYTTSDAEHGRGFKINTDELSIVEYGLADVAFC